MRCLLYCIVAVLFAPYTLIAQCEDQWIKQISALPNGYLGHSNTKLTMDEMENVIVTTTVFNTDSIVASGEGFPNVNTSTSNHDILLAKYSPNGELLWLKVIDGQGQALSLGLTTDNIGNIYMSGSFNQALTIDGTTYSRNGDYSGYYISKFSPDGQLDWFKSGDYTGSSSTSIDWTGQYLAFSVSFLDSVSVDGMVYYADNQSNPSNMDGLVGWLTPEGDVQLVVKIRGSGNFDIKAMTCDSEGCVIQGKFDQELICGSDTLTTPMANHYSLYHLAVDNEGLVLWGHSSINSESMFLMAFGLGFTQNGEVHFSGVYDYSSFTLGDQSLPMPQERDVFVGSLERNTGEVQWLRKGNGNMTDYSEAHAVEDNGSLLGGFFYSLQFEFEGETFSNTNDDQFDGFIVSLDSVGKARCGLSFPGVGQNAVCSVKKTADGYVVALISMVQLDFADQLYTAQGQFDLLLIKTCLPCDTLTSIAETTSTHPTLHIYPNPANQSIRVEATGNNQQLTALTITDMLGHAVLHQQTQSHENTINISGLANGIYAITATLQGGETRRERLVVQR